MEATDEAGHQQNAAAKVAALESWDREIIGPLLDALPAFGPFRILLMPDHATPVNLGTHTSDPVPYLLHDSGSDVTGRAYTESATVDCPACSSPVATRSQPAMAKSVEKSAMISARLVEFRVITVPSSRKSQLENLSHAAMRNVAIEILRAFRDEAELFVEAQGMRLRR